MKPALQKSLVNLSRPICLAALGLLLINDHLLRQVMPSWWTGKLGDFAWLLVAPFGMAALLAMLLPGQGETHERWVGGLAFGLVGGVFALVKILPEAHDVFLRVAENFGMPLQLRRDSTDLIALSALFYGWHLWQQEPARHFRYGWIALVLVGLLTVANSAQPEYGITCLMPREKDLLAFSTYQSFVSTDGGLTWSPYQGDEALYFCNVQKDAPFISPVDQALYDFEQGMIVKESRDGGKTWQTLREFTRPSEAEQNYYVKTRPGTPDYITGPLDIALDTVTGNLVVAMGQEGVQVRKGDGSWVAASVGVFKAEKLDGPVPLFKLLQGEFVLGIGLGLLLFCTWNIRLFKRGFKYAFWVIAWLIWLIPVIIFPPATTHGYGSALSSLSILGGSVIVVPLFLVCLVFLVKDKGKTSWTMVLFSLGGILLFLLPYVLWGTGALPRYWMAVTAGLLLAVVVLATGARQFWRKSVK